jgi:hypothetical protein
MCRPDGQAGTSNNELASQLRRTLKKISVLTPRYRRSVLQHRKPVVQKRILS